MRPLFENSDAVEMPVAMPGVLTHLNRGWTLPVFLGNGSSDQPERKEIRMT
jgi:hypothetical protein